MDTVTGFDVYEWRSDDGTGVPGWVSRGHVEGDVEGCQRLMGYCEMLDRRSAVYVVYPVLEA